MLSQVRQRQDAESTLHQPHKMQFAAVLLTGGREGGREREGVFKSLK
jgi:hypothetical protein